MKSQMKKKNLNKKGREASKWSVGTDQQDISEISPSQNFSQMRFWGMDTGH